MSKIIYTSPLSDPGDIRNFVVEGASSTDFGDGCMKLSGGPGSDALLWVPKFFPADVKIEWEFRPAGSGSFGELFFAARPLVRGADMFGSDVATRDGIYSRYHSGDISAFHVSYYRRSTPEERSFHTCELRKSCGYCLVAEGADPIPETSGEVWYRMCVVKRKSNVSFFINDLKILEYDDDGRSFGDQLTGGFVGIRQQADTQAFYRNLKVTWI